MVGHSAPLAVPVLVCGAGAAGMAAAIAAARAGSAVELVERSGDVGGTMADALLHTLAGLYDSRGAYVNAGLARELAERLLATSSAVRQRKMGKVWVLSVDPDLYREVCGAWVRSEPRITIRLATTVLGFERAGSAVVAATMLGPSGEQRIPVRAIVDATGGTSVASMAADGVSSEGARNDDSGVAAAGWIFRMRGVDPSAFAFPRNVAVVRAFREAALDGRLPADCAKSWIDAGLFEDEIFVKLFVPLAAGWRQDEERGLISEAAKRTQDQVVEFLKTLDGFGAAFVTQTGKLGIRDGGRAHGEYTLTRDDVLSLRRFEDAACRCAWPVEYWDPKEGVSLTYLPDGEYYEIPMRALKVQGIQNVWVAGKNLSADAHAQASARCVGTCWSMGEAAGTAAAKLER